MSHNLDLSTPPIEPLEYYHLIRGQIEHEDNLNSQRLSWFVASQSFFFTAYAIVMGNSTSGRLPWVEHQHHLLAMLIPVVATLICLLIYVTVIAGTIAIVNLRRLYNRHGLPAGIQLPPVQGFRLTQLLGQAGPLLMPPVFIAVWLVLLSQSLPH